MSKGAGPDSARSWAIAGAGFVINFLLSGISRSTGLFYVALIDTYGVSRMEANMPFTLRNIVRNLLGPLVGIIGQRCGAREATMVGGLFAAVGVASCSFVSDVTWISLLWGGIHGIGVALGNTLFQITINQYFEKFRATASGLALSGACVGSLIFPILLEYILTNIGLSGTFLITGGLMLNVVPAGIPMIEPSWAKKKSTALEGNVVHNCSESNKITSGSKYLTDGAREEMDHIFVIAYKRIPSTQEILPKIHQNGISKIEANIKNGIDTRRFEGDLGAETLAELGTKDSAYHSPENNLSIYQSIIRMICDPMFHMISLSLAAYMLLFDMSLTIVIDYLKDKGIRESDGKYFISLISVGDFAGRLCFGWVTDRNYMSLAKYMMLLQIIQGCAFGIMPFFHSFDVLVALVMVYGIAGGASVIMYPILVEKYLHSVQSLGIGFITFVGGILAFGIPPMIGYFRDAMGSYDSLYFIIGAASIVTGLLWGLEPLLLQVKIDRMQSS